MAKRKLYSGCCGKLFWKLYTFDYDKATGIVSGDMKTLNADCQWELVDRRLREIYRCGDTRSNALSVCGKCLITLGLRW